MDMDTIYNILQYLLRFGLLGIGAILMLMAIAVFRCPKHIWDNSNDPSEILSAGRNRRLEKKRLRR